MTDGAAALHLTRPAVSRTIAALERRLGEALFVRGRRPLCPTPLGRALAVQGQGVLAASRRASETVLRHSKGLAGLVRSGGTPFFGDALIATMLAGFHRAAPDVCVEQRYGYTRELVRQVRDDELDHPPRALGLLSVDDASQTPAVLRLLDHLQGEFDALRHLIRRHERAVVWGD